MKGIVSHITRVLFSPDGSRLAAVNWDMQFVGDETPRFKAEVLVWDGSPVEERNEEPVLVLRGHTNNVLSLAFSPDGQSLASGGEDRMVRVWDIATGRGLRALGGGDHGVNRVAFGPDGTRLASGTNWGEIRLWDVATGREPLKSGGKGEVMHLKFSPDGTRLASSHRGTEGGVWVWEVATGRLLHVLRGHTWGAYGSWFSADGTRFVTAGGEAAVKTWDLTTGREVWAFPLRGSIDRTSVVAFRPDGTRIIRLGQAFDRTARIWDLTSGEELVGLKTGAEAAWSVEFSPDGRRIATADWAMAKVWDAATGMSLLTLRGHTDRVRGVAFSPDGKRLGTASTDQTVRVWDLTVLDEVHTHELALDP